MKRKGRKGMKGRCLILGLAMLVSFPAYAEECETPSCLSCPSIDTDTNTQRIEWGYGVGADLVIYKQPGLIDEVFVEGRYDIENRETRVYAVAKVDLTKIWS